MKQLELQFEHRVYGTNRKELVRIRIPKHMAEQYLFDFENKELTKKQKSYNK
jgi:hypothetical protein